LNLVAVEECDVLFVCRSIATARAFEIMLDVSPCKSVLCCRSLTTLRSLATCTMGARRIQPSGDCSMVARSWQQSAGRRSPRAQSYLAGGAPGLRRGGAPTACLRLELFSSLAIENSRRDEMTDSPFKLPSLDFHGSESP
jgi:hypothetical protein